MRRGSLDSEASGEQNAICRLDALQGQDQNTPILSNQELDDRYKGRPSPWTIALILGTTIVGFTVQTEATAYYQEVLDWPKPFCSFYLTHSCLTLPWLWYQLLFPQPSPSQRKYSWLRKQLDDISTFAASADAFQNQTRSDHDHRTTKVASLHYVLRTMAVVTLVLTVSGISWFSALAWTTPSDLTVIYNCSAFFAAVFSVPLLKERLTRNVVLAVIVSFGGTIMIAYGSGGPSAASTGDPKIGASRVFGNLIAMIGACAYGLYCVLFKKWTLSSKRGDATSSLRLTLAASGLTGLYILSTFWIVLLVFHFVGIETLALPSLQVCFYLFISVIPGSVAMTFVLVLTAWTNPVFGSVASILCVFFVAMADWILFRIQLTSATYTGGALIFLGFGLLSWDEFSK